MSLSILQSVKVGAYVMKQRIQGTKRYPLVLMLEPLFRCNLECAGCGKIREGRGSLYMRDYGGEGRYAGISAFNHGVDDVGGNARYAD